MKFVDAKMSCEQASVFYYDYISGTLENVCSAAFNHIEKCEFCSNEVERLKTVLSEPADVVENDAVYRKDKSITTILASHFRLADKEITCGIVKQFIPSLAGSQAKISVPTPITTHIESCPLCKSDLEAVCGLHLTEEQLNRLGRIITVQTLGHSQGASSEGIDLLETIGVESDKLNVLKQVLEHQESGIVTKYITQKEIGVFSGAQNRAKIIRKLIKPIAAMAALFLIGILFFVGTFANAIEYDDVYDAISRVQNIYLVTGESVGNKPSQETWISTALNVKLSYFDGCWTLWDIQNRIRKTQKTRTESSEIANLDDWEIASIKQTMNIPLGVLPFQSYSFLPEKCRWKLLANDKNILQINNTDVYDLSWVGQTANGCLVYYKWRAYIDKATLLPRRAENWRKESADSQYKLIGWTNIKYPNTQEIKSRIHSIEFIGE